VSKTPEAAKNAALRRRTSDFNVRNILLLRVFNYYCSPAHWTKAHGKKAVAANALAVTVGGSTLILENIVDFLAVIANND